MASSSVLGGGKQRLAVAVGKDVVQIKMQLSHAADAIAARTVDRNNRLAAQLEFVSDVEHAGIDRTDGTRIAIEIGDLRLQIPFHKWDQPIRASPDLRLPT